MGRTYKNPITIKDLEEVVENLEKQEPPKCIVTFYSQEMYDAFLEAVQIAIRNNRS
jgi:hypothetical protein